MEQQTLPRAPDVDVDLHLLPVVEFTFPDAVQNAPPPCTWGEIVSYYRGCSLQNYFTLLAKNKLMSAVKAQLDAARFKPGTKRTVADILAHHDARGFQ